MLRGIEALATLAILLGAIVALTAFKIASARAHRRMAHLSTRARESNAPWAIRAERAMEAWSTKVRHAMPFSRYQRERRRVRRRRG
jgi:hypothetical protein